MDSFDTVTRQGVAISDLFGLELVISGMLLAVVVIWLALALVRFRAGPAGGDGDGSEPPQVHGNRRLEVVWTLVPALALAYVFLVVIQTLRTVDAAPADAIPLRITGHQWWWEYAYPELQALTANELHVPVGQSLLADLESVDVIHSFHVPQFGWMRDNVPGKSNRMSILVNRAGQFNGTCNQFCGLQHAWMRVIVISEPSDRFNAWVAQQRQLVVPSGSRGEQVFLQNTCVNCHAIRGLTPQARVGPDLTHMGSRSTLGTGVVDNTPQNLQSWIRNASAIKPGVLMPPFPNLSAADLAALADYLESLR